MSSSPFPPDSLVLFSCNNSILLLCLSPHGLVLVIVIFSYPLDDFSPALKSVLSVNVSSLMHFERIVSLLSMFIFITQFLFPLISCLLRHLSFCGSFVKCVAPQAVFVVIFLRFPIVYTTNRSAA
jgi:hypothetical protein